MRKVQIWDNESLTIHLIKNDLIHFILLHDLKEKSFIRKNHSTLYRGIVWLLGIYDPDLQNDFTRLYIAIRHKAKRINYDSSESLNILAVDVFNKLRRKSQNTIVTRKQLRYAAQPAAKWSVKDLVLHLIENELVHHKLLYSIHELRGESKYHQKLYQPVLWFLKIWDVKLQNEVNQFYLKLLNKGDNLNLTQKKWNLENLAQEILTKLEEEIELISVRIEAEV